MRAIVLVLFLALGAQAGRLGRVIRVTPATKAQVEFMIALADDDSLNLDFWTHPSHIGGRVDIRVTDDEYPKLAKMLNAQGIVFVILIPDVDEASRSQNPPANNMRSGVFNYNQYNTLDAINKEVDNLVRNAGNLATKFSVGNSYEGRPMYAVKLSTGSGKKTLFMNCGIHAREWITPATCMFMLREIVYKHKSDQSIAAMLKKLDVIIMPVLNVDGYTFTWTRGNRMWRKTRSVNPGSSCRGTDPNRNWNVKWGGVGTSSNPCSDTYRGPYPFSEVESRNVARYLYSIRSSLVGYMDIHAYSQLWMTPWGHAKRAYPPTYGEMMRVANKAVTALYNVHRTTYRAGTSADIIYATTGGTMDWVTATLGVTYSYGLELRDKGRYGFLLPAAQIKPTGEETFASIKEMVKEMRI